MINLGGYTTFAGVLSRTQNYIEILIRNKPDVVSYNIWVSRVLEDLYLHPDANMPAAISGRKNIFNVKAGGTYLSKTLRKSRQIAPMVLRGQSRAVFTLSDFYEAESPQPLPNDQEVVFLAVQEVLRTGPREVLGVTNNGEPILGPILVIPPVNFFHTLDPVLTLSLNVPSTTNAIEGQTPSYLTDTSQQDYAPPLAVVFPRMSNAVYLYNTHASEPFYYSFDWGLPYTISRTSVADEFSLTSTNVKQLIVGAAANASTLSLNISFKNY